MILILLTNQVWRFLVSLIGDKEGGVHRLHAGGAGEATHEPVVDAVGVVGVQAGQVANTVSDHKVDHTYHTSGNSNLNNLIWLMY